jgi:predicted secreted protein
MAQGDWAGAVALNPLGACTALAAWMLALGAAGSLATARPQFLRAALAAGLASAPVGLAWAVLRWWMSLR